MPLDPPAQEDPPLPPSGSRRALIMEHEKAIVEILAEVLAGEGVKALGAPDMKNATMMLAAAVDRAESIDLIVANNVHGGAHCEPLLDWIRASTLVYGD
ncbi:MAG: hypothetical protein CME06_17470, partial [Gemmatimonadetes bacterium]|nr:hypothetical protein [Gemmatimonadota bacterium]